MKYLICASVFLLYLTCLPDGLLGQDPANGFSHSLQKEKKPWTEKPFYNQPENFQFVIVSDRTGGHREGVFGHALSKVNQLYPEFVMSVGDLIEGYTKDDRLINEMWDEFHGILDTLDYRFFYVAGNHDYSNEKMGLQWKERYGYDYYHFIYKDVLFLILNTNDGDGVVLSEDQIAYMKQALADHPSVRWTLLFMHHPIWRFGEANGYAEIEQALEGREYTVFAGHTHRYFHEVRMDRRHYVLATTGGGSQLRGPRFGEYDHVSWVTMTDQGPQMINLSLSGMIQDDISNAQTVAQARALFGATRFQTLVMEKEGSSTKKILLQFENDGAEAIHFTGRFYHHHQVQPDSTALSFVLSPQSMHQVSLNIQPSGTMPEGKWDPLEMVWEMGYATVKLDQPFVLSGVKAIELAATHEGVQLTEQDIFLQTHQVQVDHPYKDLQVRYTLDGSEPGVDSPTLNGDIPLVQSTEVAVVLADAEGFQSQVYRQQYEKVQPLEPVKVRRLSPGLRYRYYEGAYQELPDFETLTPLKSGVVEDLDPEKLGERLDHYAIQFEGYLEVPTTGIYTFYVVSDDGSQLFVGDRLVVDNDGSHSARMRKGMIALEAGVHPVRIDYFEDFLGEELRLSWEGPGISREAVPFSRLQHKK